MPGMLDFISSGMGKIAAVQLPFEANNAIQSSINNARNDLNGQQTTTQGDLTTGHLHAAANNSLYEIKI